MLNNVQCELARVMTQDTTDDSQINKEFNALNSVAKAHIASAIDNLLKLHDMPIDKGFEIMREDFIQIANEFSINPATLFCIYMENKPQLWYCLSTGCPSENPDV